MCPRWALTRMLRSVSGAQKEVMQHGGAPRASADTRKYKRFREVAGLPRGWLAAQRYGTGTREVYKRIMHPTKEAIERHGTGKVL